MSSQSFVHLHLHTDYSMLDGAVRIKQLMKKAVDFDMPAVAMTDHGVLYGAIEFYQAARESGIKPIIGCEVYMAPGSMHDRKSTSGRDAASHFTLLAKDSVGYHNLVKLVSLAHLEGYYYKPRIDKDLLAKHSQGLIGLSGCLKGEINLALQADQRDRARRSAAEFRDIFGADNFYLELHDHGLELQRKCNAYLPTLAREFGLGLVAANDVHFLERDHHEAHDVMICIGTGANVTDEKRMRYVPELYFKSPSEMRALFPDYPEALANTLHIADQCNLELEFGKSKYPDYRPPEGKTRLGYLRELCEKGFQERYGDRADYDPKLRERLEYELGILEKMGFVSYFLIVWDFINYARENGIPVGPGRGSAAGSMVAFVLGITDIDPIRFGLIFERFLNPERVSPPDIDVDFCQSRRSEVIDYVRRKYGERAVSQIVTFGTLGAKSVVRDVGRVLGMGYSDADRIAKLIPNELNISLASAASKNPDLQAALENEPQTRQLWDYSLVLEGLSRNTGIHAAGVVISDRDLSEYIPLGRGAGNEVVSQYSMGPLTDLGLLKMDFLGLKTLTVIHDAIELIHARQPDFNINKVTWDDPKTFTLLNRGETTAVFQLESGGMVNLCRQFGINSIDDIIALIALYRPGPMDLIPDYIARKKGQREIRYAHPLLEKISSDTYGIMIYQEQVMAAAASLAGYSLGQSDLLRRAMGKKDKEKMAKERALFVAGCAKNNGIKEKKANAIFDLLEKFAGYGFNKSHSAAYGWVAYQTAYLKANYPVEFMSAVLSNEINNTDKISTFVSECNRMGITILPPNINRSGLKFRPEVVDGKEGIRFGLAAVKNVGEGAMQAAIVERDLGGDFQSIEQFCARVDSRKVNKKVLESLVKAGAFDFCGFDRAVLFSRIDTAMSASAAAHRDRAIGQVSLFDDFAEPVASRLPSLPSDFMPWTPSEKLTFEKDLLGFYVTGHPLEEYRSVLENGTYKSVIHLAELEDKATVKIAGSLTSVDRKFTKKDGKPFAILMLEDLTGSVEVMVWNEAFTKCSNHLEVGKVVSINGRLDKREDAPRFVASDVRPVVPVSREVPVRLQFQRSQISARDLENVRNALVEFPGSRPVLFEFIWDDGRCISLRAGERYKVEWLPELQKRLSAMAAVECELFKNVGQ